MTVFIYIILIFFFTKLFQAQTLYHQKGYHTYPDEIGQIPNLGGPGESPYMFVARLQILLHSEVTDIEIPGCDVISIVL